MQTHIRASVGFLLGLGLALIGFLLAGIGHGTYAPMIANVSVLIFIPVIGVFIAVFGPPFLWAFYFFWIPSIVSRARRSVALASVALLHLIPALWFAFGDSAFKRALQHEERILLAHGLALTFAIAYLAFVSAKVAGRRDRELHSSQRLEKPRK